MRIVIDTEIIKNNFNSKVDELIGSSNLAESKKKIKRSIRAAKKEIIFFKDVYESAKAEVIKHQERKNRINSFSVEDYE